MFPINEVTGIRYGYVDAKDLMPEVVENLLTGKFVNRFRNYTYEAYQYTIGKMVERGEAIPTDAYEEGEEEVQGTTGDGVTYSSVWSGGALGFRIHHSPATFLPKGNTRRVYTVPDEWRLKEDDL